MHLLKEKTFLLGSLIIIALIMGWLAFTANGTGDWGDAIYHYLYSRYAFQHPENFLSHWAKPIFVLFTAPIAQGGFIAMKFYNIAMLLGTIGLTWLVAKRLDIANAWLVVFLIMTAPMSSYQTLSGLTEPMFACWLMVGVYGLIVERYGLSVVWLSFLPFVRSEGLVVLCVVFLYLCFKNKWYLLPLLAVGHIVYSLVGYFYYYDFLWVFNKMSYATLDGAYGSGPFWHFADKMHTVIGDFQPALLIIGLLVGFIRLIQYWSGRSSFSKEKLWLVYGIAVAYFLAHSIFWYFGIFNSFGLMRVIIGVLPLFALIMLEGINAVIHLFPQKNHSRWKVSFLVVLIIALFWFFDKKIKYPFHFVQNAAQSGQNQLVEKHIAQYPNYTYYFDAVHLALPLEVDWFDPNVHRTIAQLFTGEPIPAKSLVFWDHIFIGKEQGIPLKQLEEDARFRLIECLETGTWERPKPKTCLFVYDSSYVNNKTLLATSFEESSLNAHLDSTIAKTGKFSQLLNKEHPYSKTFSGYLRSFQQYDNAYIRLACWVYTTKQSFSSSPQVIISYESNNQSFSYNTKDLFTNLKSIDNGRWQYITFEQKIVPHKMFHDQVKVYIWNPDIAPIFIDDLKIDWYIKVPQE